LETRKPVRTDFETLRSLAIYTINHLQEGSIIEYAIDKRAPLIEAMATEFGVCFSTDEDIKDQAIEEVEEKLGESNLPDDITETEMYIHARKEIIKGFQGENLGGLYLIESLNKIAHRTKDFLLNNELIDEVFATDEELVEFLVEKIRRFTAKESIYKQ
jgi:hypothetical protein